MKSNTSMSSKKLLRDRSNTVEYNSIYSLFLYTIRLIKGILCPTLYIYIYIDEYPPMTHIPTPLTITHHPTTHATNSISLLLDDVI